MSNVIRVLNKFRHTIREKPLTRGMIIYSITWPLGSLIQQTVECKEYSLARTLKFSLYGSLYVAPTLYGWMRFSCFVWPRNTAVFTILKAYTEQITYAPFAISSFLFIMTLLEGGSTQDGIEEVNKKLVSTWKISAVIWPILQSVNYTFVPEKNRVPFIGFCSLAWTVFLTFVKYHNENLHKMKTE